MAPPPKNQAEIDARNRWTAYQSGWKEAARGRRSALIADHPDKEIAAAYILGRADYEAATQDAIRCARKRFRVPGTPASDILRSASSGPSFNHSRADGPFDPCPVCLEQMDRDALLALVKDLLEEHPR